MILTVNKEQLLDALSLAMRAVSVRSTVSILECILLTATDDGAITLSGNDKELAINTTPITAEVDEPGSIALDAKLFSDIIRKMTSDSVHIETDDKFNAVVKSGRSRLKISGHPADEFPLVPENELENVKSRFQIKSPVLKEMIRQTIFSVSIDQSKLVLTGELFEIKDSVLQLVAIDMFRISYRSEGIEEGAADGKAVVPGKALNELNKILSTDENEMVSLFFTENKAVFETSSFRLVSSLLTGDFIRYDQIFNEDFTTMIIVDRAQLLGVFERAVLVAMENRMLPVKMDIQDDDVSISAQSDRGLIEDGVPCESEGKDLTIYFNPRYFIEALKAIEDERVVMKFNTTLSPCTIRGTDDASGFKYLIVPLKPPSV